MKKALLTGITGQDGSYLADLLLEKGYEVHGLIRRTSSASVQRIEHLFRVGESAENCRVQGNRLHYGDLTDASSLNHVLREVQPDEVYNLGAQSHVKISFDIPEYTGDVVGMGTPGLRDRMAIKDQALLLYAGLVAQRPHSAGAIASILRDYFRAPAAVVQFLGQWFPLEEGNVTKLGEANSELGRTVVAGASVFVSQSKFRVRMGPLTLAQFVSFLPVGPAFRPLTDLVRYLAGLEFDYDVQLVLRREEVPPCSLDTKAALPPMLGWTSWVTSETPRKDADEVVLPVDN